MQSRARCGLHRVVAAGLAVLLLTVVSDRVPLHAQPPDRSGSVRIMHHRSQASISAIIALDGSLTYGTRDEVRASRLVVSRAEESLAATYERGLNASAGSRFEFRYGTLIFASLYYVQKANEWAASRAGRSCVHSHPQRACFLRSPAASDLRLATESVGSLLTRYASPLPVPKL